MKTTVDTYPVFDANQVLTDEHLNTVVHYLDEQQRLTRADLIGVGISCGLELETDADGGSATVTKGCGVSSEGYLLIEPGDVALTRYRDYRLPDGDHYPSFMDGGDAIALWELFPDGEANTTKLDDPAGFLDDKCVILFLEKNQEDLTDCSPSNCDDKGAEISLTLRRLLANRSDVERITAAVHANTNDAARLALPDLRLRRYDVPRTGPVTTRNVLEAFQRAVMTDHLPSTVLQALDQAYEAFKPLLEREHPSSPFGEFSTLFSFLESMPTDARQVTFLQYYTDLFSDLLLAYEEFRSRAMELVCVCCPPEDWFPRHLVLGPQRRTGWHPSRASAHDCETLRSEVVALFTRMVQLTKHFRNNPSLREASLTQVDEQIRITPSRAGNAPLSLRCIPYYYDFAGTPPLYEVWNPALTAAGRAQCNQGYRCNEYFPAAPAFVTGPLAFDLEPFDFLRIEGHLGKDYRGVLARLQDLRDAMRLPFDIVAVRTGAIDDSLDVDPSEHACWFQDLDSAYKVVRAELVCLATKAYTELGKYKFSTTQAVVKGASRERPAARAARPRSAALGATAAFVPLSGTTSFMGMKFDVAKKNLAIAAGTLAAAHVDDYRIHGSTGFSIVSASWLVNAAFGILNYLATLTARLPEDLHAVDWELLEQLIDDLKEYSESISESGNSDATEDGLTWQELNRQIASVAYSCRLESLLAVRDEYLSRLERIRKLASFDGYAKEHPAIQHKAGVPCGGTFVVVYHDGSGAKDAASDIYTSTIGALANGTVIADFCLPYRCCSDCAPIQFVLTAPEAAPTTPPSITTSVSCTDDKNQAEVEVTAAGGTEPYVLRVDGVAGTSFREPQYLTLDVGSHILEVSDVAGAVGAPVTVQILPPLKAAAATYTTGATTNTFNATFSVGGGKEPYTVSAGSLSGTTVTVTDIVGGAAPIDVVITDAAGCKTTARVEHASVPQCNKPCSGKATRSRYPAWAPKPGKSISYAYKQVATWSLTLSDDRGEAIPCDSTATAGKILTGVAITDTSFNALMTDICVQASAEVEGAVSKQHGSGAWKIEFDPATRTVVIESYACHTFSLVIGFVLSGNGFDRTEEWIYSSKRVTVVKKGQDTATYDMPAFGVIQLDKCTGSVGKDCTLDLRKITLSKQDNTLVLTPEFDDSVNLKRLDFYWRVDGSTLQFSKQPTVKLSSKETGTLPVQLLVVDQLKRCWAFLDTSFSGSRPTSVRFDRRRG